MSRIEKKTIRYTASDYLFLGFNWIVLSVFLIVLIYPLLYILASSISGGASTMTLWLIPKKWSFEGYRAVIEYPFIRSGYRNSLIYMTVGTAIAMLVTICCAYPLSRHDFAGRKPIMTLCIFTMYFSGGLIPTYLWIRDLGLYDTIWALVLPGSLSVYNMIIMRTYFQSQIPEDLYKAALIDGCGDLRFLISIALPLSGPILAVIALYYAVAQWNAYFNAMVYIQTRTKLPLPNVLREILVLNMISGIDVNLDEELATKMEQRAELMKYSLIVVASLPVMVLYPLVQKYFVKGVMIGAIKG